MKNKKSRHINPAIINFIEKAFVILMFSYSYVRITLFICGINL